MREVHAVVVAQKANLLEEEIVWIEAPPYLFKKKLLKKKKKA